MDTCQLCLDNNDKTPPKIRRFLKENSSWDIYIVQYLYLILGNDEANPV